MESSESQQIHLDYPEATMYQLIERTASRIPNEPAYEFYGHSTSYSTFMRKIRRAARAFQALGIRPGDAITLCLPNVPQTLDAFYGVNYLGAVANMIHPLSAQNEITFYLNLSKSKLILTLDLFYEKVLAAAEACDHPVTILVARIQDELNPILKTAYIVKKGKSYLAFPHKGKGLLWKQALALGARYPLDVPEPVYIPDRTAVILYSGGTSGTPKGIRLTDLNFNACAMQAVVAIGVQFRTGLKMLSCMPCFHGFGLGINLHTVLVHGACCILMPTFTNETYASALIKKKPHFIAGVPTIFEALLHLPSMDGADLSFLMGMFCGGDALPVELKKRVDAFLASHGAHIQVQEGYGLTECVTASCLTPHDDYREGSIGLPFPDTLYSIVRPGTDEVLPPDTEGEIILTGPTLMQGYLDAPTETAETLRTLADGRTWLYTGDLGRMDADGFVYFSQRIKRMIISKGYNVYPSQLENVIDAHPDITYSCVIGVPDTYRGQRIIAYIVPREGVDDREALKDSLMAHLRLHVAAYALPKELIIKDELPKTLVGKVAYRLLMEDYEAAHPREAV